MPFVRYLFLLLPTVAPAQTPCPNDSLPPVLEGVGLYSFQPLGFLDTNYLSVTNLILSVADDCTPSNQIELGLRWVGTGTGFPEGQTALPTFCENQGYHRLEVWARDAAGNTTVEYEVVYIYESVPIPPCGWADSWPIHIFVKDVNGQPLHRFGALYRLYGNIYYHDSSIDHYRSFPVSPFEMSVQAYKRRNPLNGVSTYDLYRISRHILGIEPFDSPYQWLAADVNRSNSITAADIVALRKLILGIVDTLPRRDSWRFMPENYVFPNPADPLSPPLPDSFTIPGWTTSFNLVALKIGDVTNNANPAALDDAPPAADDRLARPLYLPDTPCRAGEPIWLPVYTDEGSYVGALQLALRGRRARFLGIRPGALSGLSEEHYTLHAGGSKLRLSWFSPEPIVVPTRSPLFYLHLLPLENGAPGALLELDRGVLSGEIVGRDGGNASVRLETVAAPPPAVSASPAVMTVRPNPFVRYLYLDGVPAGPWRFQLFDVNGRLLWERSGESPEDGGTVFLDDLPPGAPGVYGYRFYRDDSFRHGLLMRGN